MGDDLQNKINNLGSNDRLVILPGTHEPTSPPLTLKDDIHVTILGTVKLPDASDTKVIDDGGAGVTNVTIDGGGVIDGNKANQSYTGTDNDHPALSITNSSSDIVIRDIEVKNCLAGATVQVSGDDMLIENCYAHTAGNGTQTCDGFFTKGEDVTVRDCVSENVTDTHFANDNPRNTRVVDCVGRNTSTFNTNNQTASNGVTGYAIDVASDIQIRGTVIDNNPDAAAFTTYSSTVNDIRFVVDNCDVLGGCSRAVRVHDNATPESRVEGVHVASATASAIYIQAANINVSDCRIESADNGFYVLGNNATIQGCDITGSASQDIQLDGATDCRISDTRYSAFVAKNNADRYTLDGLGVNSGDPSAGGVWNGNGYEGVIVRDTTNANTYIYNNGGWSQIASA